MPLAVPSTIEPGLGRRRGRAGRKSRRSPPPCACAADRASARVPPRSACGRAHPNLLTSTVEPRRPRRALLVPPVQGRVAPRSPSRHDPRPRLARWPSTRPHRHRGGVFRGRRGRLTAPVAARGARGRAGPRGRDDHARRPPRPRHGAALWARVHGRELGHDRVDPRGGPRGRPLRPGPCWCRSWPCSRRGCSCRPQPRRCPS